VRNRRKQNEKMLWMDMYVGLQYVRHIHYHVVRELSVLIGYGKGANGARL
jgi:hypothetical protein